MLTPGERRVQVQLKIERAKTLQDELQRESDAFLADAPFGPGFKIDPNTKEPIYFCPFAPTPPIGLSLIAGDVIQNLRSALDHLAYQLMSCDLGDPPPNASKIYFPIGENQVDYDAKKQRQLPGASTTTITAIDAVEPYDEILWALHSVNNTEKHRLLLTVGSAAVGVNVIHVAVRDLKDRKLAEKMIRATRLVQAPADATFPLRPGQELFRDKPGAPLMADMQFRFRVAFNEPGLPPGVPVLDALRQMTERVQAVADALFPLFEEQPKI